MKSKLRSFLSLNLLRVKKKSDIEYKRNEEKNSNDNINIILSLNYV